MEKSASRVSDIKDCPKPGHGSNPVTMGSLDVIINDLGACRVGDTCQCAGVVTTGCSTVMVNSRPLSHVQASTSHGGLVRCGSPNVFVGVHTVEATIYDEQFRIIDNEGEPLRRYPFLIEDGSGHIYKGLTDDDGCCPRIHTEAPEVLSILLGVFAVEKWCVHE
ncbi:MAG: hypothetical protein HC888_19320 [Candidatus Competibacteraceae bacterium]|nr:hypothetical protein [Candidatus Competibacteraceae bacterium]